MFTESVRRNRASLQGDNAQVFETYGRDYPVKDKLRERFLQDTYISVGLFVIVSLILGTGFGFLIMIL